MKKTINLPQNYLDAMKELLKEDYEDYLASFEEKRLYGLRINTLKISVEDFLKISPFELEPIPWKRMDSIFMRKTSLQSTRIILQDCITFRSHPQ